MKKAYIIFLLLCYWASVCHAENDEMPIIGYWGVPESHTNGEAFRTFAECGQLAGVLLDICAYQIAQRRSSQQLLH